MTFEIPGRLPGLNELVGNSHWATYARKKKVNGEMVMACIMFHRLKPIKGKARVTITCYEPNARRDEDNIISGAGKIILDALKKTGIIHDDSQKWCHVVHNPVEVDRDNPRIVVEVEDVEV